MEKSIFFEIALVLSLGTLVSLIMRIIKQPMIIGYILTGILASPAALNLIHDGEALESLSTIGISLLLFIVGLGLNPKTIKELGLVSGITGVAQVLFSTIIGYFVMVFLGRSWQEALVVGVALAFSSTILGLKLLSDKKEQSRLYGRIAVGVLLVQDILATIALVFVSTSGSDFSLGGFAILALKGLMIGLPIFLFSFFALPKLTKFIGSSQEFLFLFALAWGFGIGALFKFAGYSLEIGSLIAGVSLAVNPLAQEVGARLKPIRDFFLIVFFIYLGSQLGKSDIGANLPLALLFSAIVLITNPITIALPMIFLKHTKLNAFRVGMIMAQISEFSLIFTVLAAQKNIISNNTVGLVTLIGFITIAVSSYMIIYSDQLYYALSKIFPFMLNHTSVNKEKNFHLEMVIFGYRKGGSEFIRLFEKLNKKYALIDYDPEIIESMNQKNVPYIFGDATDIELLEEINISKAKLAVSVISDHATNLFLLDWLSKHNSDCVFICNSDNYRHAIDLYEAGASYVLLPHLVGSEKISSFIKKSRLHKNEFKRYRQKHIADIEIYLESKPKAKNKLGRLALKDANLDE